MEIETVAADAVRLPPPRPGVATTVRRYREERAVVLHPTDFHRLAELEAFLLELSSFPLMKPSDAAITAHVDSDTPGSPIVDPATLDNLFAG